ncbi:MAG: TadE/TadG family type IV pilus assembly protein, partial [Frankia sp.]
MPALTHLPPHPVGDMSTESGRARRRPRGDAGLMTPAAAAVFPIVLLLIMAVFQGVVYYQAEEHAQAAAAEGARAARLYTATAPAGAAEARLLLTQTG